VCSRGSGTLLNNFSNFILFVHLKVQEHTYMLINLTLFHYSKQPLVWRVSRDWLTSLSLRDGQVFTRATHHSRPHRRQIHTGLSISLTKPLRTWDRREREIKKETTRRRGTKAIYSCSG